MQPGSMTRENTTNVDWALLVVRLVAAIIFAAHGAQKLFGAFGGPGLDAIVQMMGPIGYLVAIGEFFGALGLAVGFLSRFAPAFYDRIKNTDESQRKNSDNARSMHPSQTIIIGR